jgi:hypothetical protein
MLPRRAEFFWASVPKVDGGSDVRWVQRYFAADLGESVTVELSPPASELLEVIDPEKYYTTIGHDARPLRVPADLDRSICLYQQLSQVDRGKFDRAAFWFDMASRYWDVSVSSSFASLVSAIESLTGRGTTHRAYCERCKTYLNHEVPSTTERFRAIIEKHAPGAALKSRRTKMYTLRSRILHGSELMQIDEDLAFGWDPPWWNQREMHDELWRTTRLVLRNWLRDPSEKTAESTEKPGGVWSEMGVVALALLAAAIFFVRSRSGKD